MNVRGEPVILKAGISLYVGKKNNRKTGKYWGLDQKKIFLKVIPLNGIFVCLFLREKK